MNHKVLLADDSLTIQKVIKITLANQPYDIIDCPSEDELFHQLPLVMPKLVFLDFNLSEKYTGYELTTKIKSLSPSTKVLLLLGTFDTVDDGAMEKCGASDKIVKPFDSNKFIAICKQLIETFADEDIPYPEAKDHKAEEIDAFSSIDEDEQWTVSHSTEQKFSEPVGELDSSFPSIQNALDKEVSDWGMSVPGVINDDSPQEILIDLPPVIGEVKSLDEHRVGTSAAPNPYEVKFPENDDLDYPDMGEPVKNESVKDEPVKEKPKPQFISLDSFNDTPMDIEGNYVPEETDVKSIEAQIRDEVEEDLWQADEFEDLKKEVSQKIEEAKSTYQPSINDFDESLFKPLDSNESIDWNTSESFLTSESSQGIPVSTEAPVSSVNMDELRSEMEEMVKKYVKEYMDQYFQKNTEKIAWEVIPDLAENLIRQELSKISNKIINDSSL